MNLLPAYGNPAALTDEVLTRYYDLMLAPGMRVAMIDRLKQTVLFDPVPLLRRIGAPTLILWGEKAGLIPVSNSAEYVRFIPNSILVRLPDLGHVPQEEVPAIALEPVRSFLAQGIVEALPRGEHRETGAAHAGAARCRRRRCPSSDAGSVSVIDPAGA